MEAAAPFTHHACVEIRYQTVFEVGVHTLQPPLDALSPILQLEGVLAGCAYALRGGEYVCDKRMGRGTCAGEARGKTDGSFEDDGTTYFKPIYGILRARQH